MRIVKATNWLGRPACWLSRVRDRVSGCASFRRRPIRWRHLIWLASRRGSWQTVDPQSMADLMAAASSRSSRSRHDYIHLFHPKSWTTSSQIDLCVVFLDDSMARMFEKLSAVVPSCAVTVLALPWRPRDALRVVLSSGRRYFFPG